MSCWNQIKRSQLIATDDNWQFDNWHVHWKKKRVAIARKSYNVFVPRRQCQATSCKHRLKQDGGTWLGSAWWTWVLSTPCSFWNGPGRRTISKRWRSAMIDGWIASEDGDSFKRGIHKLPKRWLEVITNDGEYIGWFTHLYCFRNKWTFAHKNPSKWIDTPNILFPYQVGTNRVHSTRDRTNALCQLAWKKHAERGELICNRNLSPCWIDD